MDHVPPVPPNSFRVVLEQSIPGGRLDSALMEALRNQSENPDLKALSRGKFKELFAEKRIQIKGQPAKASSTLARGTTYVDLLGFGK
jgi:hypothetical protein